MAWLLLLALLVYKTIEDVQPDKWKIGYFMDFGL